jgi:hypothetical protein
VKFEDLEREMERDLESRFCAEVKARGGVVRKLRWEGMAGAPDRLVLAPGPRMAFVELKRADGTGRISKLQARELRLLRRLGFDARVVATDEDADQFMREFF